MRAAPSRAPAADSLTARFKPLEAADGAATGKAIKVSIVCPEYITRFGENLCVVGSCPELGAWDVAKAPLMTWNTGHRWTLDLELAGDVDFKVSRNVDAAGRVGERRESAASAAGGGRRAGVAETGHSAATGHCMLF